MSLTSPSIVSSGHTQALTDEDGLRISTKSMGIFSCFSLARPGAAKSLLKCGCIKCA